jgi:predicted PurR-regulated permease PerM
MTRLFMILFSVIATSMMGAAIVAALTTGYDTLIPILVAAGIGFVAAIPVTWMVTKQLA